MVRPPSVHEQLDGTDGNIQLASIVEAMSTSANTVQESPRTTSWAKQFRDLLSDKAGVATFTVCKIDINFTD